MSSDFDRIAELLEQDVARTLGEARRPVVRSAAENVMRLDVADPGAKLVEDVQQSVHDTFVDTTWPVCPLHRTHPLWYADSAWWCTQEREMVAPLGELSGSSRPAG